MGMGGGGQSTQTVVQQNQIPQYLQQFTQENQDVARDIASRPFPTYNGQRIANLDPAQTEAYNLIGDTATGPWADQANVANYNARNVAERFAANGSGFVPLDQSGQWGNFFDWRGSANAGSFLDSNGHISLPRYGNTLDPNSVAPWMSPYIEQALQPQLQDIQRQSSQNRLGLNAGATAAGAFGDASLGVQQGENDRNTAQLMNNTVGTGYQNAYDRAVGAAQNAYGQNAGTFFNNNADALRAWAANAGQFNTEDAAKRAAWQANAGQFNAQFEGQRAATALNDQIQQHNNAGALANSQFQLGAAQSIPQMLAAQYGLTEQQAQDLMSSGQMSQQFNQQGLSTAYQDFLNQFEYPQEMLNLRLATAQNQPYSSTRLTTTPYSQTAQSIGALATLFGGGSRLFGGSGSTA